MKYKFQISFPVSIHLTSFLILSLTLSLTLHSQEIIFPGLNGDSLITEIRKYYTPKTVLPYDQARIKLYNDIFLQNDSLECFYSGYKIPVPSGTNILAWTAKYGIQTEHLYPRSLGAAAMPALGDLHHLVPSKATINTMRKNSPFGDIPDDKTKYWLLDDKVLTRPDQKLIDHYSESSSNVFEPRNPLKAISPEPLFYFYSTYGATMLKKSRSFFTSMLPDIPGWHRRDRVDSTEYKRTMAIGRIQSNINPFVFDPTLVERCYCAPYPAIPTKSYTVNIYPNPSQGLFYIDIPYYKGPVIIKISDHNGKLLETHHLMYSGLMTWRLGKGIWNLSFYLQLNIETYKIMVII
ncbi:MAG: endonuclease [Saprospiraceae bacterium]|nr:endonuclease [Saprospiraceae bacterium]